MILGSPAQKNPDITRQVTMTQPPLCTLSKEASAMPSLVRNGI